MATDTLPGECSAIVKTVGMDMTAPFGVYVNGEQVAEFVNESDAEKLFSQLRATVVSHV